MLVAAGADLSAKDGQGKTPLHYLAALGGHSPMQFINGIGYTFLLAKVDVNARDSAGDTPLHIAARSGARDVYDWLIKEGASLDATNNAGETPRQLAVHSTDPFSRFQFKADTDMFEAIREGKLESVAAILKSAPDLLNQTNRLRQTPLMAAAQARHTNIVDFLDAHGARWDSVSAIHMGRTEIVRNLIAQQPQLAVDGSLLRSAATDGNIAAAETLLAAGADLKGTGPDGLSPLGIALVQKHGDMAELLKKHGAAKNIFDVIFSGDAETAAALINKDNSLLSATNAVGVSVAEVAAACGNENVLKLLLDKGVSPNFENPSSGRSLLHAAAAYNRTNTAQLLIQRHARLTLVDNFGFTPLHVSALRDSVDVLEMLLKHKADCNQVTASPRAVPPFGGLEPARQLTIKGNTPVHLAALAGQTNVIVVLLKWGASVNATNADGMTPLDLAGVIVPPPLLLMRSADMHLPIAPPFPPRENPMLHRRAAITLLEQAGGKHGERRGLTEIMPFGPPMMTHFVPGSEAPGHQAPVLQTGADYHAQGCLDYNAHRFTDALADYRKSCELGPENQDYSCFRIWLIRARLGEEEAATRELAVYLDRRKTQRTDDWPSKVGRFLVGQLSESDFLKAADDPNLRNAKEHRCEAYFYVGSRHLIGNDKMGALDCFKKCLTTNVTDFEEYTSATSELFYLELPSAHP
jgi:ankyrin repeat protein